MKRPVFSFSTRLTIPQIMIAWVAIALVTGCFPDSQERQNQLQTLARWEDQRLAPHDSLTAMLRNDDAHVRLAAARSAGLIGRTDIAPILMELADDSSVTVRAQAIFSLGFLNDERSLPVVTAALQAVQQPLRISALKALAHLDNDGKELIKVAVSGPEDESQLAWTALRNMVANVDSTALEEAIKAGLLRPETNIQWRVLRCTELLPAPSLLPVIIPFAHSNQAPVRVHAYRALQKFQNQEAALAILNGWENQNNFHGHQLDQVQIAGLRGLGACGGHIFELPETENILQDALAAIFINGSGNSSPHVAETAIEAMGQSVDNLPLPPAAAERESLLPVWRIRLARAAYSQIENSHVGIRAAAIGAWPLLRGSGCAGDLTRILRKEDSIHVLAAGLTAMGQIHPDPVLILRQYSAAEFRTTLNQPVSTARHNAMVRSAALEALAHIQRHRPEILTKGIPADFIPTLIASAAREPDFVISATACGLLGDFPSEESISALVAAYLSCDEEGAGEIQRAALAALASILKTLPADDGILSVISSALDSPDIRVRLAGRNTAIASGHFEGNLLPSVASLKATIPVKYHSHEQPPVSLTFPAPKVRCSTERGPFIIELNPDIAPNTCATFLDLVEKGFYNNLTFHRVVPDFVAQAGCPRADGSGGPGYTICSEWSDHTFERGIVGIAHDGKDTGGSQFFITLSPQPHLDGRYTIFGRIKSGMEVVDLIEKGDKFSLQLVP